MRASLIAGNWKLHHGPGRAAELARTIGQAVGGCREGRYVALFPPFVSLQAVRAGIEGSPVRLGAQNVFWENKGAFTGEISPVMLVEAGCEYVIVGHSERRTIFGEDDCAVARKTAAAIEAGLTPIVCLGETLDQRDHGRAAEVVRRQLEPVLDTLPAGALDVVIAYEPVWAIGTGRVATVSQVEEMHSILRSLVREGAGGEAADRTLILYGGSVKPENVASLLELDDVDGALVGGASLKAETFLPIVFWDANLRSRGG